MEIWIRSQYKQTLASVKNVILREYADEILLLSIINDDCFILGTYSTKEKALKVLDMIHEKIVSLNITYSLGTEATYYESCVFQMPQDDEVEI